LEKSLESLYQIIQKLIGLHRQLLDVIRSEKQALLDMEIKEVQDCTYAKEGILSGIHTAELERQKRVAEIALYSKKPATQVTLQTIIHDVQGTNLTLADQFRSAFNALTMLTERIKESNLENSRIIDQALEHIHRMKTNVLGEAQPMSNTYGQKAQKVSVAQTSARILSEEA